MGYVITGIVCSMLGATVGVTVMALFITAKRADEQDSNKCYGCFGAANGDCGRCPYGGGNIVRKNSDS